MRGGGWSRLKRLRAVPALVAAILSVAAVAPVVASAAEVSPLVPLLMKPGEMSGFVPGKPQVFRTVSAIKRGSGEGPSKVEISRYEAEGFVEAAAVRIHGQAEAAATGISSVFEFETPTGARAEMKAELKEQFNRESLGSGVGADYFILRRFTVPDVPDVVAYAFVTNKAADKIGVESGVAKGMFIEGNCLFAVGIVRFASKKVTEPVTSGVQAIFRRTGDACP
jgi:hypothetical protein